MPEQSSEEVTLTETQIRRAEVQMIRQYLNRLARESSLTPDQRIGVCMAQKVVDDRLETHDRRHAYVERNGADDD
jgi:hypothetical protein